MWCKLYVSDDEIIKASEISDTMSQAATLVKLKFSTFKRRAESLNVYKINPGRKGLKKPVEEREKLMKIKIEDILNGLHPSMSGTVVKNKLYFYGLKENKCELCGIDSWNNNKITCEIHHIDGDRTNHKLDNLQILCPNCHSQTDTFGFVSKRIKIVKEKKVKVIKNKIKKKKVLNNKYGTSLDYNNAVKKNWDESQYHYIDIIKNSDIEFDKFGWVNKVAVIINQKPQKVNKWMQRMMLDFYNDKCFKRYKVEK